MTNYFLILPLLPILAWALGGATIGAGIGYAAKKTMFTDYLHLGILGMQGAGKTRFLRFMQGIPFIEEESHFEELEFIYKLNNLKDIHVKKVIDMGGGSFFRSNYDKILDESNVILFFFNINDYLKNIKDNDEINYQRSCNSRLEHIYSRVKGSPKKVVIIATHKDRCNYLESEIKQRFNTLIQEKSYKVILKNIEYVNLTDDRELENVIKKIFG